MNDGLYCVITSYLCAGFVVRGGRVVECAPILRRRIEYWKTKAERVDMSGFFPEKDLKNEAAEEPWMKSDTDKMLDLYFAGEAHPVRIAQMLGRTPKAVKRRLEQFVYNERDRAINYTPVRRISRSGKPWTQNERIILDSYRERNVPFEALAIVLRRTVSEVRGDKTAAKIETVPQKHIAPTIDLILAYRYAFYVYKEAIISDAAYDALVSEEVEFGGGTKALQTMREPRDCPGYIKTLALYLSEKKKYQEGKGKK